MTHIRILLVDDEPIDRMAVARAAQRTTLEIDLTEVDSGERAIELIFADKDPPFDVVILDHHLPGLQGVEVIATLRERGTRIPVVLLTGADDPEVVAEAMRTGATDYIAKTGLDAVRLERALRYARRVGEAEREAARAKSALEVHARKLSELTEAANRIHVAETLDDVVASAASCACDLVEASVIVEIRHRDTVVNRRECHAMSPAHRAPLVIPLPFHRIEAMGELSLARDESSFSREERLVIAELARTVALAAENVQILEEATANARARHEIVAMVSHDLRTPLHAFALGLDVLSQRPSTEIVARLKRNVDTMNRLIGDVLDITRIQDAKLSLTLRPQDPYELAQELVEELRAIAEKSGIALTLEGSSHAPLECDRERVRQALSNLIGNAIKFTPKSGRIVVRVIDEPQVVSFEVADTGPGIPTEEIPRLFERLWQGRDTTRGAGLGLYISKGIVEAHGGTLRVTSAPDLGSTFSIVVPRRSKA